MGAEAGEEAELELVLCPRTMGAGAASILLSASRGRALSSIVRDNAMANLEAGARLLPPSP